jgi:hypothetical protein
MIGFHYLIFFENFAKHDVEMTIVALPATGRLLQKNMPQNQKKIQRFAFLKQSSQS